MYYAESYCIAVHCMLCTMSYFTVSYYLIIHGIMRFYCSISYCGGIWYDMICMIVFEFLICIYHMYIIYIYMYKYLLYCTVPYCIASCCAVLFYLLY